MSTHPTPDEPVLDTSIGGAADRAWFAEQRARIHAAPQATHVPCCSSHNVDMDCATYRRTHFVEVGNCLRRVGHPAAAAVPQGTPPTEIASFDAALRQAGHVSDAERGTEDTDYRLLADHIIALTNPPDDDVAEVSIVMDAVSLLHQLAVSLPCQCPASEMGDDYGASDACPRCRALGQFNRKEVTR